jgi:hypothetical protein
MEEPPRGRLCFSPPKARAPSRKKPKKKRGPNGVEPGMSSASRAKAAPRPALLALSGCPPVGSSGLALSWRSLLAVDFVTHHRVHHPKREAEGGEAPFPKKTKKKRGPIGLFFFRFFRPRKSPFFSKIEKSNGHVKKKLTGLRHITC